MNKTVCDIALAVAFLDYLVDRSPLLVVINRPVPSTVRLESATSMIAPTRTEPCADQTKPANATLLHDMMYP